MKTVFLLFILSTMLSFPQDLYYLFNHQQDTYNEITGGTISSASGNDGSEVVSLPFNFQYGSLPYPVTSVRISVNGWISPGTTYNGTGWLNDLASSTARPLIAPLWDDLYHDSGSEIMYQTIGNYPQRVFIVQWKGIRWNGASGTRQNFQVRLFEEDFRIEFIYGVMTQPSGVSASIGLNTIGTPTPFMSITPDNPPTMSQTTANNSINSVAFLTSGTKYSFIPLQTTPVVRVFQIEKKVARGAVNQPVIGIQFSLSGPITPPTVNRFRFKLGNTTNQSDILNVKVFYTGSSPRFSDEIQFGQTLSNPPDSFDIVGSQEAGWPTNYYWLAFDISPTAQPGNLLDAECKMIAPIGIPDTANPTGTRMIVEGVGGDLTIGTGMNFNNITEALAMLDNAALKSAVRLKLMSSYNPSTESFPIILKEINGANNLAGVTIQPDVNAQQITITSSAAATFDFREADFFNITGRTSELDSMRVLTIENSSSQGHAIKFDGSSNNKIEFCNIFGRNSSTAGGVVTMRVSYGRGNRANLLSDCFISRTSAGKPNTGIYYTGNIYPWNLNNEIRNCEITNFHDAGIFLTGGTLMSKIEGNKIHHTEPSSSSTVYGIRIDNADAIVSKNKIYNLRTQVLSPNAVKGIFIIGSLGSALRSVVHNNFISMTGNVECPVDGIDYNGYAENSVSFFYNSIYLNDAGFYNHTSSGIKIRGASNNMEIKNNIVVNKRYNLATGDGKHYAVYVSNTSGITSMNYNNFFSLGTFNHLGYWNGTVISSLAAWQAATQFDINSVSKDVQFISDNDLHLTGVSLGDFYLTATPINSITIDFDGEPRHPLYPYMGADESLLYPLPVELISFNATAQNGVVTLNWTTSSETNNKGFEILRSEKQETISEKWIKIGFVEGKGTTTKLSDYTFIDTEVKNSGKFYYCLKQIDFDGSFDYSKEVEVVIDLNPSEFALFQNYPNPFNPTTTIKFNIPTPPSSSPLVKGRNEVGFVNLKVYDILGKEVATLVNDYQEAGSHQIDFNASNFPSGVYIYQLRAGNFISSKTMMVIK